MPSLNSLALKIPKIFDKLNTKGLTDTMSISSATNIVDSGGAIGKQTWNADYENVPCSFETKSGNRNIQGGKPLSEQEYLMTFPTHLNGSRIDLTVEHKFIVNSRGNEPAKTFRIIAIQDVQGVVFEVVCVKEN